jgi:hypothetical protein
LKFSARATSAKRLSLLEGNPSEQSDRLPFVVYGQKVTQKQVSHSQRDLAEGRPYSNRLILPIMEVSGRIWILENL